MGKNKLSEPIFKEILSYYKPQKNKKIDEDKIDNLVNKYYQPKEKTKIFYKYALSFAIVLFILYIPIILFFYQQPKKILFNKITISQYETQFPETYILENEKTIKADNIRLKIENNQFIILLNKKSEINILNNKDIKENIYYLKKGMVFVNADQLNKNTSFELYTKLGKIKVLGTQFSVQYNNENLIINCYKGIIQFIDLIYNEKGNTIIEEGKQLIIKNIKEKKSLNILSKNLSEKDDSFPELQRQEQEKSNNIQKNIIENLETEKKPIQPNVNENNITITKQKTEKLTEIEKEFNSFYEKGLNYMNSNQLIKAIYYFGEAITLQPDSSKVYNLRGRCYYIQKEYELAINDFNMAIKFDPKFTEPYINLGLYYIDILKDKETACGYFKKACELGDCSKYEDAKKNNICE